MQQYLVRASYLEIYQEEIRDLLSKPSANGEKKRLELKERPDTGVYVKDLSPFVCKSQSEIQHVMAVGNTNRTVGPTNMNEHSSRSHAIFIITVECSTPDPEDEGGDPHITVGKLNLVDLAGSERQAKTGAEGERLKEATKINLSLSALGNVISALVDGKSSHVPYRDSKLTRLLQDSLGGNTKTVMVANLGPADYNYDETLSTLRYAYRAKSIKNKPRINEDPKDAMIREFQEEIMRLKGELMMNGGEGGRGGEGGVGGPLPPRIEKKTEYVEKIVEKVVEKEVIINGGASEEEKARLEAELREQNERRRREAEDRKAEIMARTELVGSEKRRLMAEIEAQNRELNAEAVRKHEMQSKLVKMEEKMVVGKQVMEKAMEQEQELKKEKKRLRKQQEKEAELKRQEELQRQENIELDTKCATQEEQVQKLTAKLQKLWDKYQKAQQEMVDVQHFNQSERV